MQCGDMTLLDLVGEEGEDIFFLFEHDNKPNGLNVCMFSHCTL
jgi:hypothetical protein